MTARRRQTFTVVAPPEPIVVMTLREYQAVRDFLSELALGAYRPGDVPAAAKVALRIMGEPEDSRGDRTA